MSWIIFAIVGYMLAALVFLLDKYIIKSRIPEPSVYAFYMGFFSIFALALIPLLGGFRYFGWEITMVSILSGIIFVLGLTALYRAIKEGEISRIAPLVGAIVPMFVMLLSLCGCIIGRDSLGIFDGIAFFFLTTGGLLLALEFPFRRRIFFQGFVYALLAGLLMALFFALFKYIGEEQNFSSAFVWSRLGMVLGAFSLTLYTPFRKKILRACCNLCEKKERKKTTGTFGYFVLNKIFGGTSHLAIGYAVFLGPVVLVQAMTSMQYALVVLFTFLAGYMWPDIFREQYGRGIWIQKTIALTCIVIGLVFVAQSGL